MEPSLDTKDSIEEALNSGVPLEKIAGMRKIFARCHHLHNFYVNRGTAFLDSKGNLTIAKPGDVTPANLMPDIGKVVEADEFWDFISVRAYKGQRIPKICFRLWFDSMEGIAGALESLEEFNNLRRIREVAGKIGLLDEWLVLGRYKLDQEGKTMVFRESSFDRFPDAPKVIPYKEFRLFLEVRGANERILVPAGLPSAKIRCVHCGERWEIGDCHDFAQIIRHEDIPLDPWVEKKGLRILRDVRDFFGKREYGDYILASSPVRNPDHVTLSWSIFIKGEAVRGSVNNPLGLVPEAKSLDYVIRPGDIARFDIWLSFHWSCYAKYRQDVKARETRQMFENAGFRVSDIIPVACSGKNKQEAIIWPCLIAKTGEGAFKVCYSSQGIVIDWRRLPKRKSDIFCGCAKEINDGVYLRGIRRLGVRTAKHGQKILRAMRLRAICRLAVELPAQS